MNPSSLFTTLIVAAGTALSASGADVYNSFGPGDSFGASGRLLQGEAVGTIANVDQAASFTVGASDYSLTSISLGLNISGPGGGGAGPLDIILASDNGGEPGAVLQTISLNLAVGTQVATGAAVGLTILTANTTYWVIADAMGTLDGGWNFNDQALLGNTAGRSAPTGTFAYGVWNLRPNDDQLAFRVEGRPQKPVPDSANMLALLGLAAFALKRAVSRWS